ncbi:hypothetical protein CLU79DRAFT_682261, partial [Phycomyces nitens]
FGRSLGFERLNQLQNRAIQNEDSPQDYPDHPIEEDNFTPGTKVVRVRPNKSSKMDSNYKPEVYTVIAGFGNSTYQLADMNGRLLKRR